MYLKGNEMKCKEMNRATMREMTGTAYCVEMIADGR